MAATHKYLATKHGIVLQQPAYSRYYINLGEISSYPPGYKENAGIFCHVNPWVMIGETRLGHGDQAHDYYSRINPSAREEISELHRCEPYVYAQMIAGKDAPTFGEAKNSWLTGTAAWNYYAIVQWILGMRATLDGLEIAPVIPESWPGFTADPHLPRSGLQHHHRTQRRGQFDRSNYGRRSHRREYRTSARERTKVSFDQGDSYLVTSALIGASCVEQIKQNIEALANHSFTGEELAA